MKHAITCLSFRPMNKGTLRGFATINIREIGLTIHDITLHEKNGGRWVSMPGKPWVKDGVVMTKDDGKIQYSQVLEFNDRGIANAFGRSVWRAVEEYNAGGAQ